MSRELHEVAEALLGFVGLESEWEDSPAHRAELDRDIVVAADRFRARWGHRSYELGDDLHR